MELRKKIKKFGHSFVIRISPEEMKLYNLKIDDIVAVSINKIEIDASIPTTTKVY